MSKPKPVPLHSYLSSESDIELFRQAKRIICARSGGPVSMSELVRQIVRKGAKEITKGDA